MTDSYTDRLVDVLHAFEDGIYIIREDYTVEFMNHAMVKFFGEGLGKKCHQVVNRSEERCPWCRMEEVLGNGETLHSEVHVPTVDRTFHIIEVPVRNLDGTRAKLNIYRDITDHKDQQERLRVSEEDYRRLFEHVGVGVYISSKEGKFLNANPALLDMLGYGSKEEFLKIDILHDLYVRPGDRQKFQQMIERDGRVIDYEVNFKRKDGSTIPVLLTANVRYDGRGRVLGYEGICVDQSQRRRMEQKIREAHDFLHNIIQSSPDAIFATDMNGRIVLWNRVAEEMLGYRADEVVGKVNIADVFADGIAVKMMQMMRSPEYGGKGKLRSFPMVYERRDGSFVEGNLSAAIIYDARGNEVASVGIFVDLKERLEMERKLRQTQEQLLHSEKLAAMGRLTSQLAHELNNPLYGIMNTLELMKTEIPPHNRRRKLLEMSLSETMRLSDMLRKMLSFSKPDQVRKKPLDVNQVLEEILMLHEKQLQEHSILIRTNFDSALPPVYASSDQLRQVFLNMISNARDAMAGGGTLTVSTTGRADKVIIRFADTGIGIKPEHLDKIFETFFTTKESVKGVGLGLSVCYGFIKDHGGDITVESRPGEGTTFTISLPAHHPAA